MTARLSLVVSTIGRTTELQRLVASVESADRAPHVELVLVDQSADGRGRDAVAEAATTLTWRATTSPRGLSLGRNTGLALATGDVVAFPNDTASFPPQLFGELLDLLDAHPELSGVSGVQRTAEGALSMLRWLDRPCDVSRRNFFRTVISSSLFVRRSLLDEVGAFDPAIGTGAPGPVQAGEESDLVLRALAAGHRLRFEPSLAVVVPEPRDDVDEGFVAKMRGYGVGQGALWRRHRLPPDLLAVIVARKVVGSAVRGARGHRVLARADLAYVRGCVRGLLLDPGAT